jgi:hypothetical protein
MIPTPCHTTGVDFDIEAGQSAAVINNLVARAKEAETSFPHLQMTFTIATLGATTTASNLVSTGDLVVKSVLSAGLKNYAINLMVMDYGECCALAHVNRTLAGVTGVFRRRCTQHTRSGHQPACLQAW